MLGFMGSFSSPESLLSSPLDLYLHGYVSSRLMRFGSSPGEGEEEGFPLTIAATHMDGLVLALTPNHHSVSLIHMWISVSVAGVKERGFVENEMLTIKIIV